MEELFELKSFVEQGKYAEALDEIRTVLDRVDPEDPLREEYEASLLELQSQ